MGSALIRINDVRNSLTAEEARKLGGPNSEAGRQQIAAHLERIYGGIRNRAARCMSKESQEYRYELGYADAPFADALSAALTEKGFKVEVSKSGVSVCPVSSQRTYTVSLVITW